MNIDLQRKLKNNEKDTTYTIGADVCIVSQGWRFVCSARGRYSLYRNHIVPIEVRKTRYDVDLEPLRNSSQYPRRCADYGGRYHGTHIADREIYRQVGRWKIYHQTPCTATYPTNRAGEVAGAMVRLEI